MCNTKNATERLKREYVENALSLAESFTRQWWASFKAGNEAAAQTAPRGALLPRCGPDAQAHRGQRNVARAVSPTRATPPPRAHAISRLTLLITPASSFRAAPIQYQGRVGSVHPAHSRRDYR